MNESTNRPQSIHKQVSAVVDGSTIETATDAHDDDDDNEREGHDDDDGTGE